MHRGGGVLEGPRPMGHVQNQLFHRFWSERRKFRAIGCGPLGVLGQSGLGTGDSAGLDAISDSQTA